MTICERVFRDLKFELPSTDVKRFIVTRELVDNPSAELKKILEAHQNEAHHIMAQLVHDFAQRFNEMHNLRIRFTEEAAESVVTLALDQGRAVRDVCAEKFKDFQFGLKLIFQNTGQREFVIDPGAVEAPDKALSEWVVASYRGNAER